MSPRLQVLGALAVDIGALGASLVFGLLVTLAYLFTRTRHGLFDVAPGDSIIALAIMAAAFPAWTALEWQSLLASGGTLGSRVLHAPLTPLPRRGLARWLTLALHPSAAVAWFWLGLGLVLPLWYVASGLVLAIAVVILALGVATLTLGLIRPGATSAHARVVRFVTARYR
jgi:hypothetical protein